MNLEEDLVSYIYEMESRNGLLTDVLIVKKAEEISNANKISNLKFSAGWLDKLKKRNFMKSRELHKESASIKDDKDTHNKFLTLLYKKNKSIW